MEFEELGSKIELDSYSCCPLQEDCSPRQEKTLGPRQVRNASNFGVKEVQKRERNKLLFTTEN